MCPSLSAAERIRSWRWPAASRASVALQGAQWAMGKRRLPEGSVGGRVLSMHGFPGRAYGG